MQTTRGVLLDGVSFAVVDVETTGVDPTTDAVVEVACVIVRGGHETQTFSSLVDPSRAIPPRASAVHHLTDDAVCGQPTLAAVGPILATLCRDAVVVAHNAAFDRSFLPMLADRPSLCTLRLARRCFPELDGHANQLLRYALHIAPEGIGSPHRALDDARVTASVLGVLLRRYLELGHRNDVTALLEYAATRIPLQTLPFGEHRGKPLAEIPAAYLQWIRRRASQFDCDSQDAVRLELERREPRSHVRSAARAAS